MRISIVSFALLIVIVNCLLFRTEATAANQAQQATTTQSPAAQPEKPPASKLGKLNPVNAAKASVKAAKSIQPVAAATAKVLNPVNAAKQAKQKITDISKTILPQQEPAQQIRDKWALIVGLELFHDNSLRPVKYAQTNALLLSTFLANPDYGRFGANRIVLVTNNKATKNNVAKALGETWLLKNALPNDLIVLYFATRAKLSEDGSDVLMYMFDTPSSDPKLGAIPLKATLKELRQRTQSNHIICLLDLAPVNKQKNESDDSAGNPTESGASPSIDATASSDVSKLTLEQIAKETDTTILSASEIGGRSYPSSAKRCSHFMENLLEGLSTSNGQIEFQQVAQYVGQMVKTNVDKEFKREQIPVLATPEDSESMLKTVIGVAVKSSTPEKQPKIGHPPERAPEAAIRPKVTQAAPVSTSRSIAKKPAPKQEEEDESYDNASFGNVDFGPYMDKMKKDIQSKWKPPKGFNNQRVIAVFSIKKDGTIANAEIVDGSGVETVDQSAMEALNAASPLDPLPTGSPPYVQIRYQFDWKVTKN